MADSERVPCGRGEWVQIVEGPRQDCLITPEVGGFFQYKATQPTETTGHYLYALENHNAVPESGQSFWFMSPHGDCGVWKTDRP